MKHWNRSQATLYSIYIYIFNEKEDVGERERLFLVRSEAEVSLSSLVNLPQVLELRQHRVFAPTQFDDQHERIYRAAFLDSSYKNDANNFFFFQRFKKKSKTKKNNKFVIYFLISRLINKNKVFKLIKIVFFFKFSFTLFKYIILIIFFFQEIFLKNHDCRLYWLGARIGWRRWFQEMTRTRFWKARPRPPPLSLSYFL